MRGGVSDLMGVESEMVLGGRVWVRVLGSVCRLLWNERR